MSFLEAAGIMTSVPMDPINNMSGANTAGEFAYRYFCYDGVNIGYFREYPTWATRYAVTGPFDTYRFSSNSYCKNS